MAAVDYFLKIEGIDGESTDAKHKGEIDIESWSWGESNSGASATGGGGAGKVSIQDFHFVAHTGKASPKIFLACATGSHIKAAVLTCRKAGADKTGEFLKVLLFDVQVSSYQFGASQLNGDAIPRDQFSVHFMKMELEDFTLNVDGRPSLNFGGFDFARNVVIPPPGG